MNWQHFYMNNIASLDLFGFKERLNIYRKFGMHFKDAYISANCRFSQVDLSNIWLGDRTFINVGAYFDNNDSIILEDNVCLAPYVRLLTTSHVIGGSDRRVGNTCYKQPIVIESGSWICSGATILPGVTIGKGCIIGAGAIVRDDCKPNSLYVGVPARWVRDLDKVVA